MDTRNGLQIPATEPAAPESNRERLLTGIPVTERRHTFAGVSTAVLEGGEGPPIVLHADDPRVGRAPWVRGC